MKALLTKILWSRTGRWQFASAGLGFGLGLLLLLTSLQLYLDVRRLLQTNARRADYLILHKDISLANTLGLAASTFSEAEVDRLRRQPFVEQLGLFTAGQFGATAEGSLAVSFYTQLFFESVPDAFLDEVPDGWRWNEASERLPIIVSQDFLNLYNFGYAPSQGLPQLSRATIRLVPLRVTIRGPKGQRAYEGRIVGFSDRIASVLVPDSFMRWANRSIGNVPSPPPSRLIVRVSDAADPVLAGYLARFNYQTNNNQLKAGQTGRVVQLAMSLIGVVGLFFIGLSFVLFTTQFRAVIAEAREEITLLLQLGYRAATLAAHLLVYFALFLALTAGLAFGLLALAVSRAQAFAQQQGIALGAGVSGAVLLTGLGFVGLCLAINALSVRRLLRKGR
ncbi:MAG: hypothetical protein H7Z75_01535 [Ferruginibacter sp.]|nr:hypothetical protein [Cytophagales bacterium]